MVIDQVFNQKIRTRLFKQFLISLTVVLVLIGGFLHYTSFAIVQRMVYQRAETKVQLAYELLSHWIDEDSMEISSFADTISFQELSRSKILDLINYNRNKFSLDSPYVAYLNGDFISRSWTPGESYNVRNRSWFAESTVYFSNPVNWKHIYYSKPYISASDRKTVLTMTAPIIHKDKLAGFAALDVNIGELERRMAAIDDVMGNWYIFSQDGDILLFGSNSELVGTNITEHILGERYNDIVRVLGRENDVIRFLEVGKDSFFFVRDELTGWVVAYRVSDGVIYSQVGMLNYALFGGAVLLLLAFVVIILIVSQKFTRPIVQLAQAAEQIAQGDFDCCVRTDLRDELGFLTQSFNYMAKGLKERKEYELHRARIDSELQAAKSIQSSILPKDLLYSRYFSLYAFYSAAREVGGDFYDFFRISDSCVVFCIGDVSGKGVPAAMFMTMVCTLIRAICPVEPEPDVALRRLNNSISEHNSAMMFATVFLVYYNPLTGICRYGNAGHNPLYILRRNGVFQADRVQGMLVGGFTGVEYQAGAFTLERGDSVVMYTDGITEAHSAESELFGEERLERLLGRCYELPVTEMGEVLMNEVNAFQNEAQFDDISLLIWKCEAID